MYSNLWLSVSAPSPDARARSASGPARASSVTALALLALVGGCERPTAPSAEAPPAVPAAEPPPEVPAPPPRAPVVDVECGDGRVWLRDADGEVIDDDGARPLDGLGRVERMTLGPRTALVVLESGEAWAIGATRARVPELDGAAELASALGLACGRDAAGVVRCRTEDQAPGPFEVVPLPGPATALALNADKGCALVGSDVLCWGLLHPRGIWRPGGNEPVPPRRVASSVARFFLDEYGNVHRLDAAGVLSNDFRSLDLELGAGIVQLEGGGPLACVRTERGEVRCALTSRSPDAHHLLAMEGEAPLPEGTVSTVLSGASDLCVGDVYGCAVVDGRARCWGADRRGALGAPATTRREPRAVPGIGRAVALDVSYQDSCAVNDAGEVWCWGGRRDGATGPWRVEGLDARRGVVLDAAGRGCAWGADDVGCWDEEARLRRVPIAAERVVATLGGTFCAIDAGPEARCWGTLDRLSGGSVAQLERQAHRLPRGRALAAWGDALCARAERDDTVTCTRFPDTAIGPASPRARSELEPELEGAHAWDATRNVHCALYEDALRCRGRAPISVVARAVSVGRELCVVRERGGVACFDRERRVEVEIADGVEVGVGSDHVCVRTSGGEVRCWGEVAANRLGVPPDPLPIAPRVLDPVAE